MNNYENNTNIINIYRSDSMNNLIKSMLLFIILSSCNTTNIKKFLYQQEYCTNCLVYFTIDNVYTEHTRICFLDSTNCIVDYDLRPILKMSHNQFNFFIDSIDSIVTLNDTSCYEGLAIYIAYVSSYKNNYWLYLENKSQIDKFIQLTDSIFEGRNIIPFDFHDIIQKYEKKKVKE